LLVVEAAKITFTAGQAVEVLVVFKFLNHNIFRLQQLQA
jgi:hypothetical protein